MLVEWVTTTTILHDLRDYDNDQAWRRLADRFTRPIIKFALSLGVSRVDAEDVAQDAMLAFAQSFRDGKYDRSKGRLSRWLFGVTYNCIRQKRQQSVRRNARQLKHGTSFWKELPDERQAVSKWDEEWEQFAWSSCLERARAEFKPETFQMFELVVRGDRQASDVADSLGVPVKSVYNAKHRVLKRLREIRQEWEDVR